MCRGPTDAGAAGTTLLVGSCQEDDALRVIAGSAKSIPLRYPKGTSIRPTTDAMRESLFSSLADRVPGARFADLYAGSGSVGIEALSRGAQMCVFIERAPRCLEALTANLEQTGLAATAVTTRGLVERVWPRVHEAHGPFDIVFVDPPYEHASLPQIAERLLAEWEGVARDGLVVLQCEADREIVGAPRPSAVKRFGKTEIRFFDRISCGDQVRASAR